MDWSREQILSVVNESPARVAAHDREGWLGLFVEGGVVEDPFGGAPARNRPAGDDQLGRFYDTFIGPNEIRFEIFQDCVVGLDVMRDACIHTRVSGLEVAVPAYLLYQLDEVAGGLRVRRMAAHWELSSLTRSALGRGPRAAWAMTRLFGRMVGRMGPGWVVRYLGAMGGAGARGKAILAQLGQALDGRDAGALSALLLAEGERFAYGPRRLSAEGLLAALPAGARIEIARPLSAGLTTTGRYVLAGGPSPSRGVVQLTFARGVRALRVAAVRFFPA